MRISPRPITPLQSTTFLSRCTLSGAGSLEGTLSQNTSGGVATFGNLSPNQAGTGDTLAVSLPLLPGTSLKAVSNPFNVTTLAGKPATHFVIAAPVQVSAGVAFSIMVTAEDSSNNTATGYNGTDHFSTTDTAAVLPAGATMTSGVGTFSVTLLTAANDQSITVNATATRYHRHSQDWCPCGAGLPSRRLRAHRDRHGNTG